MKNIEIDLGAAVLTIRIDLSKRPSPSKEGRLVLATTGRAVKLAGGLELSLLCLKDDREADKC